ncbi:malolactic enzyme [Selenomonas sp. F0473]|uniref:malolactic enzyme n=2 Tax=Selenomonas sp. F0473 TaxID=999423 RepID=UPI00029E51A8|nr:malolactic enzyme [Selenomonas sp. F0473]EKU71966.1 hypothetical protein HMPREF9161_00651 [Selenomonas sp. F0473]
MTPYDILNNPFLNKGSAFTEEERDRLGLRGLLPPAVQTLEEQATQAYELYRKKASPLQKREYLMRIFSINRTLFFKVFSEHVEEMMPIVYDPVIAESIEGYSHEFIDPEYAVYLTEADKDRFKDILRRAAGDRHIRLIVVTDAEEILGIGDWGTNGVDISVGKLMVYTAAAGIDPASVLPVVLDVGTNRKTLLEDPLYLGVRKERIIGDAYHRVIRAFVDAAESLFPDLYLHWEDFGRDHAAALLKEYRPRIATFNDDVQGTGIISLAGILGALRISKERLTDQIYMCFGAGTAGTGIANLVMAEMTAQGLSPEEARGRFYLVDKNGLLFDDMDDLTAEQRPFARRRGEFPNASAPMDLLSAVKAVHPTILVGTSTTPGTFTEAVVKEMAAHTPRPIVFPLSNPTKLAEAAAQDLLKWTDGKALIATGIPYDPIEYGGVTYRIGQANNALIYPGVGLGVLAVKAKRLSDRMISAAAHALGGLVDPTAPGAATLPPVSRLTEFSRTVAEKVAACAIEEGLAEKTDIGKAIDAIRWTPAYRDLNI